MDCWKARRLFVPRYKLCPFPRLSICGCSSSSRPLPGHHCYPASILMFTCNATPYTPLSSCCWYFHCVQVSKHSSSSWSRSSCRFQAFFPFWTCRRLRETVFILLCYTLHHFPVVNITCGHDPFSAVPVVTGIPDSSSSAFALCSRLSEQCAVFLLLPLV